MKKALTFILLTLVGIPAFSATIVSNQTGDWDSLSTWVGGIVPIASDEVIIANGHTVTKNQATSYTHNGNLIIEPSGRLVMAVGNSSDGFIYSGGDFHLFGELEIPFPDRDFLITGNSFFWGHDGGVLFVSDDLKMAGNSVNVVEKICLEVDDDFRLDGTNVSLCGDGGISIGNTVGSNTMDFINSATNGQICQGTIVYRGPGGTCLTPVQTGTGNDPPVAIDDAATTDENVAVTIDVFDSAAIPSDNDPNGDQLTIQFVGSNGINGNSNRGGTVSINNNGTPADPTDDFVDYIPPSGFNGLDTFTYVIIDGNGGLATAIVEVTVNSAALPVELVEFSGLENGCENILVWKTASEENNDYFEIEKSTDGQSFKSIGSLPGHGTVSQFQFYQFTDPNPGKLTYYRLRQIDFDGTENLSDIFSMTNNCLNNSLSKGIVKIFPNPLISDQLSIKLLAEDQEETIEVVNQNGEILQRLLLSTEIGINTIRLDLSLLPPGMYYVKSGRSVQHFVKLRQ